MHLGIIRLREHWRMLKQMNLSVAPDLSNRTVLTKRRAGSSCHMQRTRRLWPHHCPSSQSSRHSHCCWPMPQAGCTQFCSLQHSSSCVTLLTLFCCVHMPQRDQFILSVAEHESRGRTFDTHAENLFKTW